MVNPYSELEITKTHKDMASVPINSDRLSRHLNHRQIILKASKFSIPIGLVQALHNHLQLSCSKIKLQALKRLSNLNLTIDLKNLKINVWLDVI